MPDTLKYRHFEQNPHFVKGLKMSNALRLVKQISPGGGGVRDGEVFKTQDGNHIITLESKLCLWTLLSKIGKRHPPWKQNMMMGYK